MRYYSLDAIRGLAAIAVVHFHMGLIWHVAPFGYLAVDFFFALSGFVTETVYGPRFIAGMTTPGFFAARLRRLYPVFLVGILLGAFVIAAKVFAGIDSPPAWVVPLNLAVLPAPVAGDYFPVNVPCWTLFLEFTAYFLYAAFRRYLTAPILLIVTVVSGITLLSWGDDLNVGSTWDTIHIGIARLGFAFPFGVLLARLGVRPCWRTWLALLPPLWLMVIFYHSRIDTDVALLTLPMLLVWSIALEVPEKLRALSRWLGDISYPLYIVHYPLLSVFQFLCREIGAAGPVAQMVGTVGLLAAAHMVAFWNDRYRTFAERSIG